MNLEILVPVFNEEASIPYFINQVNAVLGQLENEYKDTTVSYRFLDNNSSDNTVGELVKMQKINSRKIEIVRWVRNYGVMNSIYGGLIETHADAVMVIDVDLQDPPELILDFYSRFRSGFELVTGRRVKRTESRKYTFGRIIFNYIYKTLNSTKSSPAESGAWLMSKNVVKDLEINPPPTSYLAGVLGNRKYTKYEISYERVERKYGDSKFSFIKYLSYAFEAIVTVPRKLMHFLFVISSCVCLLLFLFFGYVIVAKYFLDSHIPKGVALIFAGQVLTFAITLLMLTIVAEYLTRIFENTARLELPVSKD